MYYNKNYISKYINKNLEEYIIISLDITKLVLYVYILNPVYCLLVIKKYEL